jgi:hypothetical protein
VEGKGTETRKNKILKNKMKEMKMIPKKVIFDQ